MGKLRRWHGPNCRVRMRDGEEKPLEAGLFCETDSLSLCFIYVFADADPFADVDGLTSNGAPPHNLYGSSPIATLQGIPWSSGPLAVGWSGRQSAAAGRAQMGTRVWV